MVKINYDSESLQQCSYLTMSQGSDNMDLAAVTNEFVSKRNATLPCCADKISQNIQKYLFLSLINNHHDKVHPVMFFRTTLPPTNEISYRGPCALLNVNKVQKKSPGGVL